MVSLVHMSFVTLLLVIVAFVQSETLVESSNDIKETKSPMSNDQLYELYKVMRQDSRLASVSNRDLVSYIYRNFVLGNGDDVDRVKPKNIKERRHRYRKINQAE